MQTVEWINKNIPPRRQLERGVLNGFSAEGEEGLDLSGRNTIYEVLNDILAVLFPGFYSKDKVLRKR